jgi:hypothetical protein
MEIFFPVWEITDSREQWPLSPATVGDPLLIRFALENLAFDFLDRSLELCLPA